MMSASPLVQREIHGETCHYRFPGGTIVRADPARGRPDFLVSWRHKSRASVDGVESRIGPIVSGNGPASARNDSRPEWHLRSPGGPS